MKKLSLFVFMVLVGTLTLNAQEYLTGLTENIWLRQVSASMKSRPAKSGMETQAPLSLPFLDDFSNPGPYPLDKLWLDKRVLVNNNYPVSPLTQGVATFDALTDSGSLYPEASSFPFIADYLTSQFIDLSTYAPADSLYFSFFYQPQGRGNYPNERDSLVLEFLEQYRADTVIDTTTVPHDTTFYDSWQHIWSTSGMPLDTFASLNGDQPNRQVMIPVKSALWFRNDFRFRFYNYASLASTNIPSWRSNCDQWNLDQVRLDAGRSINDTLYSDMTFIEPAPSMLKQYTSMPYWQFASDPSGAMRDSVEMLISNIGDITLICHYRFHIDDASGNMVHNYDGGNWNLQPYYQSGYQTHKPHRWPKFASFDYPVGSDSTFFTVTHTIERIGATQEQNKQNDTLRITQRFYNYFAYDDGSAEAGYGLSPKGAMLACRFQLNTPDTLRGAQMFFNRVIEGANQRNFALTVWADNNGIPGQVIYQNVKLLKPLYTDSLNSFANYLFDATTPIVLDANNLSFFIGWEQQTDDNLNIGWDANSDASDKLYYNIDGTWQKTDFIGTVMMRPMVGPKIPTSGKSIEVPDGQMAIIPNPSSGIFSVALPELPPLPAGASTEFKLSVYTVAGSRIQTYTYSEQYDLSYLPRGIYFLVMETTDGYLTYQGKLVISK